MPRQEETARLSRFPWRGVFMHLPIKSIPQDTDHFCTLGYVFYTGISIKNSTLPVRKTEECINAFPTKTPELVNFIRNTTDLPTIWKDFLRCNSKSLNNHPGFLQCGRKKRTAIVFRGIEVLFQPFSLRKLYTYQRCLEYHSKWAADCCPPWSASKYEYGWAWWPNGRCLHSCNEMAIQSISLLQLSQLVIEVQLLRRLLLGKGFFRTNIFSHGCILL